MTKLLLATLLTAVLATPSLAQTVTETVNFDSYTSATVNDLTTRFTEHGVTPSQPARNFSQVPTGGITGGGVVSPSESNPNYYIDYCSTFQPTLNQLLEASICFKFNTALINPNTLGRVAGIYLLTVNASQGEELDYYVDRPTSANGPYILTVLAYNKVQTVPVPQAALSTGHWYRLTSRFTPQGGAFNDHVVAQATLADLGTTGLSTPVTVATNTADIYRATLVAATECYVQVVGARGNGNELLDNFSVTGTRNGAHCYQTLAATPTSPVVNLALSPNPAHQHVALTSSVPVSAVTVRDLRGAILAVPVLRTASGQLSDLDTSRLTPGLYFVQAQTAAGSCQQKLVIE